MVGGGGGEEEGEEGRKKRRNKSFPPLTLIRILTERWVQLRGCRPFVSDIFYCLWRCGEEKREGEEGEEGVGEGEGEGKGRGKEMKEGGRRVDWFLVGAILSYVLQCCSEGNNAVNERMKEFVDFVSSSSSSAIPSTDLLSPSLPETLQPSSSPPFEFCIKVFLKIAKILSRAPSGYLTHLSSPSKNPSPLLAEGKKEEGAKEGGEGGGGGKGRFPSYEDWLSRVCVRPCKGFIVVLCHYLVDIVVDDGDLETHVRMLSTRKEGKVVAYLERFGIFFFCCSFHLSIY